MCRRFRHRRQLNELAFELGRAATALKTSLPDGIVAALADLVRSMNCYYSNLIEGHNTHPVDIERALSEDFSANPKQRDLQLEAKAHIVTQRWIDDGGLAGRAATRAAVLEVHRRFSTAMPPELLWVEDPGGGRRVEVIPGELRTDYARVGRHIAISPGGGGEEPLHILTNRELARKDVPEVVGLDERKARRLTARLNERGIITAATHKAPFRIAFPASLAPALMPGLYPKFDAR